MIEKKLSRSRLGQPLAVHLGPQQRGQQVVAWFGQPVADHCPAEVPQLLAVRAAEREQAVRVGVVAAPDHVGDLRVGVGDQPVAEVDEERKVVRGQAHDLGQHPDRHLLGDGVDEVERLGREARVEHLLGQPLDEVLVDGDGALGEAAGEDLAQLGVVGRVGVDDRPPRDHVLVGRVLERDAARGRERPGVPARRHDVVVAQHRPEARPAVWFLRPRHWRFAAQPGKLLVGDTERPHVQVGQIDAAVGRHASHAG